MSSFSLKSCPQTKSIAGSISEPFILIQWSEWERGASSRCLEKSLSPPREKPLNHPVAAMQKQWCGETRRQRQMACEEDQELLWAPGERAEVREWSVGMGKGSYLDGRKNISRL